MQNKISKIPNTTEVCRQEPQPSDDLYPGGEPDGGGVHQSKRRNSSLTRTAEDCASVVGVVHGAPTDFSGRVFSGGYECGSRFRVVPFQRLQRLAASSGSVLSSLGGVSTQSDRPICQTHKSPATAIYQLATQSRSSGDRCLCSELARSVRVRVPPVLSDWLLPCETRAGTGTISSPCYTSLADSFVGRSSVSTSLLSVSICPGAGISLSELLRESVGVECFTDPVCVSSTFGSPFSSCQPRDRYRHVGVLETESCDILFTETGNKVFHQTFNIRFWQRFGRHVLGDAPQGWQPPCGAFGRW